MKRSDLYVGALALVLTAACGPSGGGGGATTAPGGKTYPIPALPGEVSCWTGTGGVEFATGYEEGALEYYLRRGWDAGSSTLTEDALTIVKGNGSRSWQTTSVDGGALALAGKYPGGTWSGQGLATGDAPAWATMTTDVTLDAGATVHSEQLAQGGGLQLQSMVSAADGTQIMLFTIQLARVEVAACEAVQAKYAPVP